MVTMISIETAVLLNTREAGGKMFAYQPNLNGPTLFIYWLECIKHMVDY